jgi:hypothetical protein
MQGYRMWRVEVRTITDLIRTALWRLLTVGVQVVAAENALVLRDRYVRCMPASWPR